ncbi:DNA cytosine methyltransferase [Desulfovibrio sp.]|uniref:DNA cytosine methyltransferase n=1 Tax=Desulfovibrio sp. TaxID=885 RepID=UPI00307B3A2C
MSAYYNEIDPFAAQWLRELIKAGHIAPGEVDTRSIENVAADDLAGFTQCHFFAGIGTWSYALRCAGWPDDRPVWTGSCPCQPFSAAGKRKGTADERHLWPSFFRLISQCRPDVIFGEQVASPDGLAWLDIISSDLEAAHYACGAVDTCAAGFGAPHIRQRLYWVADASECGIRTRDWQSYKSLQPEGTDRGHCFSCGLGNTVGKGLEGYAGHGDGEAGRQKQDRSASTAGSNGVPLPTDGFWRNAGWLLCRDGKWRPVEPGTFPLAHGTTARVGRLRGYGNAIVAPQAAAFIAVFLLSLHK